MPPRYVELIRVSGEAQEAKDTPADQRRALDRLRETRPGVLVERIDMGAVSGASDKRPDLERLFALAKAKAFDEVRVRHLDRLTRHDDLRQRAEIFGRLLDAGAVIVDGSGHVIDPSTELGELDYSLQTWMAAKERRRIIERTQAGRRRRAAEGQIQGRPPWGRTWDKKTGTWGEDRPAMALYRRLFAEVIKGKTLHEIADGLNREGITTPLGREWRVSRISHLIRLRSAIGILEGWGHLYRIPKVVDEPTWRAALAALARNREQRSGPVGHHPAMLRRVLRCGVCGGPMWAQLGGQQKRLFYVCSTHRRTTDPECRRYHPVEQVDEAVRERILADLRTPARLRAATERRREGDPLAEARLEVERADKELRGLVKEAERLTRLTVRGLVPEEAGATALKEIAQRRNAAEVERAAALGRVEALRLAETRGAASARGLGELAARLNRASPAHWTRFCREQFPKGYGVRLWPDGHFTVAGLWGVARAAAAGL